jgi:hypothetical protein
MCDPLHLDQVHASADQHADHITMGSLMVITAHPECNQNA